MTLSFFGSIREAVPPTRLIVQITVGAATIPSGSRSTAMVAVTLLEAGSIRETVLSP